MFLAARSSALGQLSRRCVSSQQSTGQLNTVKKPPPLHSYGKSDFGAIRRDELWYVDKTRFVPIVEDLGDQLFFVRPPRFGKTLFLSTLRYYYDITQADRFDRLFTGLDIHRKPTPLRNAFHILYFDFTIDTSSGDPAHIHLMFRNSVNMSIKYFCETYQLNSSTIVNLEDPFDSLKELALQFHDKNFMVLIDEYDRFANTLMFENPDAYDKIIRGISGDPQSSPLRSFLAGLKALPSLVRFNKFRTLMTGITPLVLTDASGYNVVENVSLDKRLGDLTGFTDDDVRRALRDIVMLTREEDRERALSVLRRNINGYCFPGSSASLYNPTLTTFCLKKMTNDEEFLRAVLGSTESTKWSDFLDINVRTSERVLSLATKVPSASELVLRLSNAHVPTTVSYLHPVFSLHQMLHPEPGDVEAHDRALSFMYYHGAVTLKTGALQTGSPIELRIPNEVARHDFLARLRTELALPEQLIVRMFESPSEATVHALLWSIIEKQQTLFDNNVGEAGLQHAIEAALRAQNRSGLMVIEAEKVLPGGRRCDLILQYQGNTVVLEFKRIRPNALAGEELQSLKLPSGKNWYPRHYAALASHLHTRTAEQLQQLHIKDELKQMYGGCSTINDVLKEGQKQLRGYLPAVRTWAAQDGGDVFGFVVMQVGLPLSVHACSEERLQENIEHQRQ